MDIQTEEVVDNNKPAPTELEVAGKHYTFYWSKDFYWAQFYSAMSGGTTAQGTLFQAAMELLESTLDPADLIDIRNRLRTDPDLDVADLIAVILDLAFEWNEHVVQRFNDLGVTVPDKVKAHIGKKSGKQGGKKVVKAPSRRR